jgi:hypothetical protein
MTEEPTNTAINISSDKTSDFLNLSPGDTYKGETILDVLFVTEKYIIYTTVQTPKKLNYYYSDDKCGENLTRIQKELVKLIAALRINDELEDNCYYIGSIYSICFDGDIEGAKELIAALYSQSSIGEEIRKKGKINYLSFCLSLTLLAIALSIILHYWTDKIYIDFTRYFLIATFGSIGGFMSIAIKISYSKYNFDKDKTVQILSAISRIFISMFSAVAVYIFIQSNLLLGLLKQADNVFVFYSFAILAGFSETLIPDIFKIVEKQTTDKLNNPPGK